MSTTVKQTTTKAERRKDRSKIRAARRRREMETPDDRAGTVDDGPVRRDRAGRAGGPSRLGDDGPVTIRSRTARSQVRSGGSGTSSGVDAEPDEDLLVEAGLVDAGVDVGADAGAHAASARTAGTIDGSPRFRGRADRRRAPSRRKEDRIGGVAPWVPPQGRLGRRLRMREWARRGFVPLSPGRQKLRHRILPRTVIGIAFMLMATGIGAAFSGAAFYAYYDNRLAENERTVARFVEGFDQQFTDAAASLDEMRVDAVGTIRGELEPLGDFVDDAGGVIGLPVTAGPSVWLVETRDDDGAVVVGSAFAVVGHRGGTALLTSYDLVRAATREPGPVIELLKGETRIEAEVWSWDEDLDVALVVVEEEIPTLALAGDQAQVEAVGRRVFAMSGVGGQGASAAPGVLVDHSSIGLQHTAPVGTFYNGGPLLDGEGRVLGLASTGYQPLGVDPGSVLQAPDVPGICATVLRCAEVDETVTPEVQGG